ncbi:Zinc-binding carboxypeptidase OS=Streptomyces glaucescens OX=1907 GN=SGLAU_08745 PE=3 SV=1 [Streptomyces glaucescens]
MVRDWGLSGELFKTYGAVATDDTVLLGFGLEHVTAAADRTRLIGRALTALDD